nr:MULTISPECIES: hypothetical protein [unclassified Rhodococcus (in: high G+C Gram-positive bacteria)]
MFDKSCSALERRFPLAALVEELLVSGPLGILQPAVAEAIERDSVDHVLDSKGTTGHLLLVVRRSFGHMVVARFVLTWTVFGSKDIGNLVEDVLRRGETSELVEEQRDEHCPAR